jgi:hypothetical protein
MATNFMNYTGKVTIITGGTKGIGEFFDVYMLNMN